MRSLIRILVIFFIFGVSGCGLYEGSKNMDSSLRVVSLSPSATEILFSLGLDSEIVGVTSYCDYPDKAKTKEKIGSYIEPSIEKIISLKPTLIISCGNLSQGDAKKLKDMGFNVGIFSPKNIGELIVTIDSIGKLTGKEENSNKLIASINGKLQNIKREVDLIPTDNRPKVYVEVSWDPLITAGKGSFVDEAITLAGGRNIAYDLKNPYAAISSEIVLTRDPDYIFLGYMLKGSDNSGIFSRLGWENVAAIKNKKVFSDIDPNILLRIGPRVIDGIEMIHERMYKGRL